MVKTLKYFFLGRDWATKKTSFQESWQQRKLFWGGKFSYKMNALNTFTS